MRRLDRLAQPRGTTEGGALTGNLAPENAAVSTERDGKTVTETVVETIYELLRTGALKSGDRVPSEWQLVRELSVGRSAVREAMRELAALGVIETQHGRGSFVRALPPEVMLTRETFTEHLDRAVRAELWEVRRIFEPEAAALAATRAAPSDLTQLGNDVSALRAGVAAGIRPPEDLKFHLDIVAATGNRSLARIATVIVSYYEHDKVVSTERDIIEHSAIFHAIKRGKPSEAHRAMLDHLSHENVAGRRSGEPTVRLRSD